MAPDWSIDRLVRVSSGAGHVLKIMSIIWRIFPVDALKKNILNQRIVIRKSNWLDAKPVGNLHGLSRWS